MSNFLHHDMTPVDPLVFQRSRRNTAESANNNHNRSKLDHSVPPVTHVRGTPESVIIPPTTPGARFGYQVKDHLMGGGVNYDGSPLPHREFTPASASSPRSMRSAAGPESPAHPMARFTSGHGTLDRYGHDSTQPQSTHPAPTPDGSRTTTPFKYRRQAPRPEVTAEMDQVHERQVAELAAAERLQSQEREQRKQREASEKEHDKQLVHHFLLDPKRAGVNPSSGRMKYTLTENVHHTDRAQPPSRLQYFTEPKEAPLVQPDEYSRDLASQMSEHNAKKKQGQQFERRGDDKSIAATLDEHRTRAPRSRYPRTLHPNTEHERNQLDHEYKDPRQPTRESLRQELDKQREEEHRRKLEDHEKVYNNDYPLMKIAPRSAGESRLPRPVEPTTGKIGDEEKIAQHVAHLTQEPKTMGERLGHDKREPIHRRPPTDEDRRKVELQKERFKLLAELQHERESLEAKLQAEDRALTAMEQANNPFHKKQSAGQSTKFNSWTTRNNVDPAIEEIRSHKNDQYKVDAAVDLVERQQRATHSEEAQFKEDQAYHGTDPWHWNSELLKRNPIISREARLDSPEPRTPPPAKRSPGTVLVNGREVRTKLPAFVNEHLTPADSGNKHAYHQQLDHQVDEHEHERERVHTAELQAEQKHLRESIATKLDPKLRRAKAKDHYRHVDPRKMTQEGAHVPEVLRDDYAPPRSASPANK